jgi:Rps23 Pro-64 3,4-dihydroxylase Tpa1-like proline 4-hydroxylase
MFHYWLSRKQQNPQDYKTHFSEITADKEIRVALSGLQLASYRMHITLLEV